MLVKTEAQESLEFGLKIHSFADVHIIVFWRRGAKAVQRHEEHSIFRDDLREHLLPFVSSARCTPSWQIESLLENTSGVKGSSFPWASTFVHLGGPCWLYFCL